MAGFKKDLDEKVHKEMARVSEASQSQRLHCHGGDPASFAYPALSLGFDHLLPYSSNGYYHGWSGGGVFDGSNGASSSSTLPNHMFFPTI